MQPVDERGIVGEICMDAPGFMRGFVRKNINVMSILHASVLQYSCICESIPCSIEEFIKFITLNILGVEPVKLGVEPPLGSVTFTEQLY